ncbi:MAG: menaquinone-dependent protoporphyrinogen oxidase [Kribbellaceae bacterium]|jgi:menaquinone-dependent protoporphyrinogen oxidase|nr:menaquinone-dependent protoporphyrinogen oxidase [Kribbellaceae bacterium]
MSRKVLVAYATKMGSTAGIAQAVGAELQRCGHQVEVRNIRDVGSIAEYDVVVVGSAVYLRRWRAEAVRFLRRHAKELRNRQVWLFHSGSLGQDKDVPQDMPPEVARLVHRIGATPPVTFPGRLDPTSARGFVARRLARGDLAGDFRDWDQITQWARGLSEAISAGEVGSWTRPENPQQNNPEGVAP